MKIYGNSTLNYITIETVSEAPVSDYIFSYSGNLVSVFRPSLQIYDIRNQNFTSFQNESGITFSNLVDFQNYILTITQVNVLPISNTFTVDSTIISEKKVTLTATPVKPNKTKVWLQGAGFQVLNIDFLVIGNQVSWDTIGLETMIEEGDKLIVEFI